MPSHSPALSNLTPSDSAALLDKAAGHPEFAKLLSDFRRNSLAILDRHVTDLVSKLGEEDRENSRAAYLSSTNIHRLTTAARQSTDVVKSRRKLARDILSAGLHNQHNLAWDMTDATTYQTNPDDMIVLLLQRPDPLDR